MATELIKVAEELQRRVARAKELDEEVGYFNQQPFFNFKLRPQRQLLFTYIMYILLYSTVYIYCLYSTAKLLHVSAR